ncbi:MAG: hypothetical protein V8T12_11035 [Parabacteroides johnsonii]
MRRIASHYIYWRQFYRMHYVELDDSGINVVLFPLEGKLRVRSFMTALILAPIPALDARLKGNKRYYLNSYSDTPFVIPSQVRERVAFDMLPENSWRMPWNVEVLQVLSKRVRLFVCCYWAAFP